MQMRVILLFTLSHKAGHKTVTDYKGHWGIFTGWNKTTTWNQTCTI